MTQYRWKVDCVFPTFRYVPKPYHPSSGRTFSFFWVGLVGLGVKLLTRRASLDLGVHPWTIVESIFDQSHPRCNSLFTARPRFVVFWSECKFLIYTVPTNRDLIRPAEVLYFNILIGVS